MSNSSGPLQAGPVVEVTRFNDGTLLLTWDASGKLTDRDKFANELPEFTFLALDQKPVQLYVKRSLSGVFPIVWDLGPSVPDFTADDLFEATEGAAVSAAKAAEDRMYIETSIISGVFKGDPGRGIVNSTINGAGQLVVVYTDGVTTNLGKVLGDPGTNGRGITSATINGSGHLIITYTDGTSVDVGVVSGTGPTTITAAQISDATVTGQAVITSIADDARVALGLKGAAVLDVGVAGGVAAYDDPRFGTGGGGGAPSTVTASQISDASDTGRAVLKGTPAQGRTALEITNGDKLAFDPAATGSRSRSFTDVIGDRVNLFNFLSDAMRAGSVDAGPGIRAACTYARAVSKRTVYVPTFSGELLVNTSCDLVGVHLMGDGKVTVFGGAFVTRADIKTFICSGNNAALSGLRVEHYGEGRILDFPRGVGHTVCDNEFIARKSNATDAMFLFGGSNYYFDRNSITNLRAGAFTFAAIRTTDDICINNRIGFNYWGGPARGIIVASEGNYVVGDADHAPGTPIHRQEGLDIVSNQYLMTGGECVYIQSISNCRITDNMWDQGGGNGCVVLAPQGPDVGRGIYGVTIIGNYLSCAQGQQTASCVRHINTGVACSGIVVSGNEMCFAREAGYVGANATGFTFSANYIHAMAGPAIRCASPEAARNVIFDNSNIWEGFSLSVDSGGGSPGDFRAANSMSSSTAESGWSNNSLGGKNTYIGIPHRLPFTPGLDSIRLQPRTAGDFCETVTAYPVSADATQVIAKVCVIGIVNNGVVTLAMHSAINARNL